MVTEMASKVVIVATMMILCMTSMALGDGGSDSSSVPIKTVEELLNTGDLALKGGDFEAAMSSYTAAIKQDEKNYNTYYKRAGLYLMKGKQSAALSDLNKVLSLNPSFLQARLRRGKAKLTMGMFEGAIEDYEAVLSLKPGHDLAVSQMAQAQKGAKQIEQARSSFLSGSYQQAILESTELMEIAPDSKELRLMRSKANILLKNPHSVIEDTTNVLKSDTGNLEALYMRGYAFYMIGERDAAIKMYKEALRNDPDHSASKKEFKKMNKFDKTFAVANDHISNSRWKDALPELEEALKIEPDYEFTTPKIHLLKCKCHKEMKEAEKAIEECTKAIDKGADQGEAYQLRAEAHLLVDNFDKAIHDYNKAREHRPQSQEINQGLHNAQKAKKMAERKDYYKILGVSKSASDRDIKKAYRKAALEWHPDRHQGDDMEIAKDKYIELTEAYEVLTNPEARQKYDNGEDLEVQPNFQQGGFNPFGGGHQGFHFKFNF